MTLGAEDLVAIDRLNSRYAHTTDTGDGPGFAACFAPDGVFVSSTEGEVVGSAALSQFVEAAAERTASGRRTHWISPALVRTERGRVFATCNAMVVEAGSTPRIVVSAQYEDELEQSPAGWRFRRRAVLLPGRGDRG